MKFRTLLMLLIGMISITAMASTPQLEQKQKTTIHKSLEPFAVIVANVQTDVSFISIETTSIQHNAGFSYVIKERIVEQLAIIDDVGWNLSMHQFITTPYKEKMQSDYIPDLRNQLRKTGIPIARELS